MQVLTRVFSTVVALAISFIKCRYNFSVADSSALTDEMLEKLIASRNANTGVFNLRQVRKQSLDFNFFVVFMSAGKPILCIPLFHARK